MWLIPLLVAMAALPAAGAGGGGAAGADLGMDGGLAAALERPDEFVRRLLHPYDLATFRSEIWGSEAHYFARSASLSHHNADLVPFGQSEAGMHNFVSSCVSATEDNRGKHLQERKDITLVKRGSAPTVARFKGSKAEAAKLPPAPNIPPPVVAANLEAGYSMVLNWMQYRSSPTAQLAEAFEAVFGHYTNINMYHTPGDEQAFLLHYDETDVFVLQLAGSKEWAVHEPAVRFARSDEARLADEPLSKYKEVASHTMSPGDMLYIPRGVPHTARNLRSDAVSTHITVRRPACFRRCSDRSVLTPPGSGL